MAARGGLRSGLSPRAAGTRAAGGKRVSATLPPPQHSGRTRKQCVFRSGPRTPALTIFCPDCRLSATPSWNQKCSETNAGAAGDSHTAGLSAGRSPSHHGTPRPRFRLDSLPVTHAPRSPIVRRERSLARTSIQSEAEERACLKCQPIGGRQGWDLLSAGNLASACWLPGLVCLFFFSLSLWFFLILLCIE